MPSELPPPKPSKVPVEYSLAGLCAVASIVPAATQGPLWTTAVLLVIAAGFVLAGRRGQRRSGEPVASCPPLSVDPAHNQAEAPAPRSGQAPASGRHRAG